MKVQPLTENERAATSAMGFTHQIILDHTDLTITTVTTGQVYTFVDFFGANDIVSGAGVNLITPFENTADAASIVTSVTFGDEDDTDALIPATELNKNGTEVYQKYNYLSGDDMPITYAADKDLVLSVAAPTTGKALSDINKGRAIFYFALFRPADVATLAT